MSLKRAAIETLKVLEDGQYTAPSGARVVIRDAQAAAVAGTRLYTPTEIASRVSSSPPPRAGGSPVAVAVTDETTQAAAHRLVGAGARDVVVLNYASARNPGGGFLNGARAQEEELCRCSGLYPTLLGAHVATYYDENRAHRSLLYTDHAIYGPRVPWLRLEGAGAFLESSFEASVITAPAPNAGPLLRADPTAGPAIRATFARRWRNVLAIAEAEGHRTLVLGAWGCGAFGNDPVVAAETLAGALADARFAGAFEHIALAIPNRGPQGEHNHAVFARVFSARA